MPFIIRMISFFPHRNAISGRITWPIPLGIRRTSEAAENAAAYSPASAGPFIAPIKRFERYMIAIASTVPIVDNVMNEVIGQDVVTFSFDSGRCLLIVPNEIVKKTRYITEKGIKMYPFLGLRKSIIIKKEIKNIESEINSLIQ